MQKTLTIPAWLNRLALERGNRNAPEYVLRLMEYMIQTEKLAKKEDVGEKQKE